MSVATPKVADRTGLLASVTTELTSQRRFATIFILALLAWMPLQTPLVAILYQYGHLPVVAARALLLLKDAAVAGAIVILVVRTWPSVRPRWFDISALVYLVVIGAYSVIPLALGSALPLDAVLASAREFAMPVELYLLGRLAFAAGVDLKLVIRALLAVAAIAAIWTIALYALPPTFWSSTLDLVTFEREVQGISNAVSLWDIGLLGQYGVGDDGTFSRAIGPFTHPVGTAHYFVFPLVIASGAAMRSWQLDSRAEARRYLALVALFVAAVITPISRGAWLTAVLALVLLAVGLHRIRATVAIIVVVGALLVVVPPFSYSISSALSRTDSSVMGHENALDKGARVVTQNPLGLGLGQADHFGSALSNTAQGVGPSAGVGENIYISLLVSVGPLGLLAFLAWNVGIIQQLLRSRDATVRWIAIAVGCAMVGYLAGGMLASPLMRFTTSSTVWLIVGLAVGAVGSETRPLWRARAKVAEPAQAA